MKTCTICGAVAQQLENGLVQHPRAPGRENCVLEYWEMRPEDWHRLMAQGARDEEVLQLHLALALSRVALNKALSAPTRGAGTSAAEVLREIRRSSVMILTPNFESSEYRRGFNDALLHADHRLKIIQQFYEENHLEHRRPFGIVRRDENGDLAYFPLAGAWSPAKNEG